MPGRLTDKPNQHPSKGPVNKVTGAASAKFGPTCFLSLSGFQFVGLISYSLYLVHWPLLQLTQAAVGFQNPLPLWATTGLITLAFPLAWLLFEYVEQPARTARSFVRARPRKTLWVAAAASIACVGLASGGTYLVNLKPLYVDKDAPPFEATSPPNPNPYVPRNMTPTLRGAADDWDNGLPGQCRRKAGFPAGNYPECAYGDPDAPAIALFGDSHALQWFPAVKHYADTHGYSIIVYYKGGCPLENVPRPIVESSNEACATWRSDAVQLVNDDHRVAFVVASSFSARYRDESPSYEVWDSALEATLESFDPPVILVADTPNFTASVPVCLSANLRSASACAQGFDYDFDTANVAQRRVADDLGVGYVDMTGFLCDEGVCPPVIGDVLIYRDKHHLTQEAAARLGPPLERKIEQALRGKPR